MANLVDRTEFICSLKSGMSAFDVVAALVQYPAKEEKPTWTKFSEKQPDVSGEYFVATEANFGKHKYFTYAELTYNKTLNGWNLTSDGDRSHELFPTYWMEIPKIEETL